MEIELEEKNVEKKFVLGPKQTAWVEALESGVFKHTTGQLAEKEKGKGWRHCCLGVCHELFGRDQGKIIEFNDSRGDRKSYKSGDESFLSDFLVKELKFNDAKATIDFSKIDPKAQYKAKSIDAEFSSSLYSINDNSKNYKQVIKFIRKFPEAVFTRPA